ncbi:MAG TPA: alkaline phosphatase PhoX [Gemmatimonadaceae bacterium]|nr:alkaline phosphatase PhoX [Gemmatimonadaceae bacterium]
MSSTPTRRDFLRQSVLTGIAISPSLAGLACVQATQGSDSDATIRPEGSGGSYGELVSAGPELALPPDFKYVMFGAEHTPMSDGTPTPGAHDGMAAFPMPNGTIRLVRNHELRPQVIDGVITSTAFGDPAHAYDRKGPGGTSTIELRLRRDGSPEILRSWMSLNGTMVNCAGGPTPWGSWLSCEETTLGRRQGFDQDHGYVFEVPASSNGLVEAVPLKAMGRFVHEALAIDPRTGNVFLTEDSPRSGFYRFTPNRPGRLREGGKLQMLAVADRPQFDTSKGQQPGAAMRVTWIDIPDVDPALGTAETVFQQGFGKGAASFARLEGAWWGDDSVYFHATSGGDKNLGQVWRYRPRSGADGDLLLVFESTNPEVLNAPDNICVGPRGGIVLCEDAAGTCHLRGLSARGEIFTFARNTMNNREFAGATFSPDGRVLFVNIQGMGRLDDDPTLRSVSFAIWGPWERGGL